MSGLSNRKIRTIIYTLIMIIGIGMAGSVWWIYFKQHRFKEYIDRKDGFSIRYPITWSYSKDIDGSAVVFISQYDSSMDSFRENLSVNVLPLPNKKLRLVPYTQMYIEQMKYLFKDKISIEKPKYNIYLGKYRSASVVYTVKMPQNNIKYMSIWTLQNGKSYMLTYAAYPDRYNFYLDKVKKMIKSFKIIK